MSRADILSVVDDQFKEMKKRLDTQLLRTDQLQRELDEQRKDVAILMQDLRQVHTLLKDLMKAANLP